MSQYGIRMNISRKINPVSAAFTEELCPNEIKGGNLSKERISHLLTYYKHDDALYQYFELEDEDRIAHEKGTKEWFQCGWCMGQKSKFKYIDNRCTKLNIKIGFLTIRPEEIYERSTGSFPSYESALRKFIEMTSRLVNECKYMITACWAYEFAEWEGGYIIGERGSGPLPKGGHFHVVFEYDATHEKTIKNWILKRNTKLFKEIVKVWNCKGGVHGEYSTYRYYYEDKVKYLDGVTKCPDKNRKKKIDKVLRKYWGIENLYCKNSYVQRVE